MLRYCANIQDHQQDAFALSKYLHSCWKCFMFDWLNYGVRHSDVSTQIQSGVDFGKRFLNLVTFPIERDKQSPRDEEKP